MRTYLLAVFLAMHGLIHLFYISPPQPAGYPFDVDHSWLISRFRFNKPVVHTIGHTLTVAAILMFGLSAITAIGFVVPPAWWQAVTIIASSISALLILLFWNRYLLPGLAIDTMLLLIIVWLNWQLP